MEFLKTVKDIKSLKIQGAENVAKYALESLKDVLKKSKSKDIKTELLKAKETLFATRPTEPCMRNALNYALADIDNINDATEISSYVSKRIDEALNHFKESEEKIVQYGSQKIRDGMVIYTHCHSSTVTKILINSWKEGKHIEVHNTETRPRFQGRITATELAKEGIPVVHYVDSAARFAIKKADIMLIGADAITAEGKVINKVGSELFAEAANKRNIPVYVCTNSWKFDPQTIFGFDEPIEKRFGKEVWDNPPKNVRIDNFAFEKIDPELITGIITELGIYKPQKLIDAVKKNYPGIIKK